MLCPATGKVPAENFTDAEISVAGENEKARIRVVYENDAQATGTESALGKK